MTTTEIIQELPRLTEIERRSIRDKLLELARDDAEVAACDEAAIAGAQQLDRMEAEDAQRSKE